MVTTPAPMTYDDLRQMPRDGKRYEAIDGVPYVSPAPTPKHQEILGPLHALLFAFVMARRLGKLYLAPTDVKRSGYDGVQPDVVFVRRDRLHIVGPQEVEGVPDLIVEIFLPSTRAYDLQIKSRLYATVDVPELWFADPVQATRTILTLHDGGYLTIPPVADRALSRVLPGLEVDVSALFADLT